MEFDLAFEGNLKLDKRKVITTISEYLKRKIVGIDYGKGVNQCIVVINSVNPDISLYPKDFETGLVINKKHTKSKRYLEFSVKLNFKDASQADESRFIDIITEALLKSYSQIESLDIKDFDIGKFYTDLKLFMEERDWLKNPEKYAVPLFDWRDQVSEKKSFSPDEKLKEEHFWEIIEKAGAESKMDLFKQIEIITEKLTQKTEKEIIGFECTLRELIKKSYHYNVMAVAKIVEGQVTDDSFLYFRCKLILYGRMVFQQAIENPNNILFYIDPEAIGEGLLSAADRAFERKFGKDTDKEYPRDHASTIIDYNNDSYELLGKEWQEEQLPKKYSRLWKMYNKKK